MFPMRLRATGCDSLHTFAIADAQIRTKYSCLTMIPLPAPAISTPNPQNATRTASKIRPIDQLLGGLSRLIFA